ncbi:MAG: response regulator [Bdellovibrionales bacterium]|nr:response regulator [Bdellovibrionales bacterium]
MALRVLLADESPTIKKVFQLSLQDYAVEVKSVNVGGDVLEVANSFKPDIVFADVLLQQMSGYQVSSEIKVDQELKDTPVVLMWSGFMDIDEDKFQASHADAKLEKPFEVENLRSLVQQLVPKVQSQSLANYLDFPKLPQFDEKVSGPKNSGNKNIATSPSSKTNSEQLSPAEPSHETHALQQEIEDANLAEKNSKWSMEAFEAVDLSQNLQPRIQASEQKNDQEMLEDTEEDSDWVQGSIENFKLNVQINDETNVEETEMPLENIVPESAVDAATKASSLIPPLPSKPLQNSEDMDLEIETPTVDFNQPNIDISQLPQLSEERLMEVIKAQSREIVERVVWQVVPELATQIIERELKRLLEEQDKNLK